MAELGVYRCATGEFSSIVEKESWLLWLFGVRVHGFAYMEIGEESCATGVGIG